MKNLIFLIFIIFQLTSYAQDIDSKDSFNGPVMEIKGDLNKDGLDDKVIVTQDTINEKSPYKIRIFFAEPDGKFKLIVSSTKLIEAQYPDGKNGYKTGTIFSDITIKNGVLIVNTELIRGYYEHKFRFQNGNFELIGFYKIYADGFSEDQTIDFNLLTGIRIEKTENYQTDEVIRKTKKKILIRPLPKLQDVIPFENELY